MPWLLKSDGLASGKDLESSLFFVHVPRCGGTSLTQHFDVPKKCQENLSFRRRWGMKVFFRRYKVLESANFPIYSRESAAALGLLLVSIALFVYGGLRDVPNAHMSSYVAGVVLAAAVLTFVLPGFIFTAPVIGRINWVRRSFLWLIHYGLCQWMESIDWCTGTNRLGYMMHLTSEKLLSNGYVTPEQMDGCCSLAIVRNPYSRMVSIYMYNRFGEGESFQHFVRSWRTIMAHYVERNEKDEKYTPCHCLPQFEFTHVKGRQLVQSVVKQEELKFLKTRDGARDAMGKDTSLKDLPDIVRDALLGMPHTNARKSDKKWWEWYDQETLDITYELYKQDFDVFGYDAKLAQRPDLKSPEPDHVNGDVQEMRRNSFEMVNGRRVSRLSDFIDVASSQSFRRQMAEYEMEAIREEEERRRKSQQTADTDLSDEISGTESNETLSPVQSEVVDDVEQGLGKNQCLEEGVR